MIRRYPKDSVSFRAKEILDYIKGNNVQATAIDTTPVDTTNMVDPFAKSAKYVFDMKASQFFMILYPKGVLNPDELINKIRSFDNLEFSEQNLQVMKGNIDLTIQYIAVMSFPSKDDAMTYYQTIVAEDNLLSEFDPQQVNYFIISQENLTELTRTKDIKAYTAFFRTKYLE